MEIKHFEIKGYAKHGIAVMVQIDYDNKMISIVEPEKGSIPHKYKTKSWIFANREIEYMRGWQHIFEAMAYAVEQATLALQKHLDAQEKATAKRGEHHQVNG